MSERLQAAKKGITQDENASHLLDLAYQQNSKVVVTIDFDDLKEVVDGRKTLWTLIDSGIVQRRFGVSKGHNN